MNTDHFKIDDKGRTILFYYAATGNLSEVKRIIFSLAGTGLSCQRYALIRIKDNEGYTAADIAAQNGHIEIEKLLRSEQGRMEYFE